MTKIKKIIFNIISYIFFGVGIISIMNVFLLYQWIHGDYERYLWIISGPDPYNKFGGGSYQLIMYSGLIFIGIIAIAIAFFTKKIIARKMK